MPMRCDDTHECDRNTQMVKGRRAMPEMLLELMKQLLLELCELKGRVLQQRPTVDMQQEQLGETRRILADSSPLLRGWTGRVSSELCAGLFDASTSALLT